MVDTLLPPAYVVRGNVLFSQVSVNIFGGGGVTPFPGLDGVGGGGWVPHPAVLVPPSQVGGTLSS